MQRRSRRGPSLDVDAIRLTVYDPTLRHRHRGKRCPFCGMTITNANFVTIEERAA